MNEIIKIRNLQKIRQLKNSQEKTIDSGREQVNHTKLIYKKKILNSYYNLQITNFYIFYKYSKLFIFNPYSKNKDRFDQPNTTKEKRNIKENILLLKYDLKPKKSIKIFQITKGISLILPKTIHCNYNIYSFSKINNLFSDNLRIINYLKAYNINKNIYQKNKEDIEGMDIKENLCDRSFSSFNNNYY
jgi:hypothetical protein